MTSRQAGAGTSKLGNPAGIADDRDAVRLQLEESREPDRGDDNDERGRYLGHETAERELCRERCRSDRDRQAAHAREADRDQQRQQRRQLRRRERQDCGSDQRRDRSLWTDDQLPRRPNST
jgi:hypothetical protein